MNPSFNNRTLALVINVDWYFELHWLARAIAAKNAGFTVHLIMAFTDQAIFDRLIAHGFICHPWQIDRKSINPLFNLKALLELCKTLKAISPDMIHAITIKPNIYVGLLAHWLKIPYLLSVTGTGTIFSGRSLLIRLIKPVVRGLYKALSANNGLRKVIFENTEDRDYFVQTGLCRPQEAVVILGAGVDTHLYRATPEPLNEPLIILFAARLLWDKGLGELLDAARLLREQGYRFTIQVAGIIDTSARNAIDESLLQEWHNQGSITWLGLQKNMPELIAKANMVVLPSFYGEGVPRILIEAASCKRAIITTDMPGCRELVKDGINGLLVPPRDSTALAQAIARLIDEPELRKSMGQQGREIVEKAYSEQQVIDRTLQLYQELLA